MTPSVSPGDVWFYSPCACALVAATSGEPQPCTQLTRVLRLRVSDFDPAPKLTWTGWDATALTAGWRVSRE